MAFAFAILSNRFFKWPYLAFYTAVCFLHLWIKVPVLSKYGSIVTILTTVIDWVAVAGFVKRNPLLSFQFWRWWFAWSLFWFLATGYGHDMIFGFSTDPFWMGFTAAGVAHYTVFYAILYAYAYREREIWRY